MPASVAEQWVIGSARRSAMVEAQDKPCQQVILNGFRVMGEITGTTGLINFGWLKNIPATANDSRT